jgi:hypothetical protein
VVYKGAPDYFSRGPLTKPWGITAVPLTYAGVANASQLAFVEQEKPDGPELLKCWKQKEPAHAPDEAPRYSRRHHIVRGVLSRSL